uniref:Uncharacterized protein n=1 Tax=Panagrolaimus superbus TaxID=310955 RepID=A0A914YFF3_9BILA
MGNKHSSTPKLTRNSALLSPSVTPILSSNDNDLHENDATTNKTSDLSNSSATITQDAVTTSAPYESDSDSVVKRISNVKEDSDSSIILDSDKSDSDVTLDEEDDVIKSEDDDEEEGLDDGFIVDDIEDGNFIQSQFQDADDHNGESIESDSSDSILFDETMVENISRPPRRRANAQQRKVNPICLDGTGSSQDPVIILPSQNEFVTSNIDNSDKSDSDVTLDEEDDVMESEEEEMSENSFIVDDEEEEEDMILTQQPTIQSDSDESFNVVHFDHLVQVEEELEGIKIL